jgi:hypothetical protein
MLLLLLIDIVLRLAQNGRCLVLWILLRLVQNVRCLVL